MTPRELKSAWLRDPCWDIEDTEGYEVHKEELKSFRIMAERVLYLNPVALVEYLDWVEIRIRTLEKLVGRLVGQKENG